MQFRPAALTAEWRKDETNAGITQSRYVSLGTHLFPVLLSSLPSSEPVPWSVCYCCVRSAGARTEWKIRKRKTTVEATCSQCGCSGLGGINMHYRKMRFDKIN